MTNPWARDRATWFYLGFGLFGLLVVAFGFGWTYAVPMVLGTMVRPCSWCLRLCLDFDFHWAGGTRENRADTPAPSVRPSCTASGTSRLGQRDRHGGLGSKARHFRTRYDRHLGIVRDSDRPQYLLSVGGCGHCCPQTAGLAQTPHHAGDHTGPMARIFSTTPLVSSCAQSRDLVGFGARLFSHFVRCAP